ncbi:MAG: cellulase family glycosylhydrolase, partial [Oscillospiraceae bacterium]|nr:cellulase family glycosylhydrolase [Oscillospiraceae bacterium]
MIAERRHRITREFIQIIAAALLVLLFFGATFALARADTPLSATIQEVNSWKEGSVNKTQYTLSIRNDGSDTVSGWTAELSVPSGSSLGSSDGWNGSFSIQDDVLTITPLDYNQEIKPGGSVSDIGFILSSKVNPNVTVLSVSAGSNIPSPTGIGPTQSASNTDPTSTGPIDPVRPDTVQGDDYLTTNGNRIVDRNGSVVWLTGINWFGYNTGTNIFDGVWTCNMEDALESIADHGFNLLRIPISSELVLEWEKGIYPEANYNRATNSELTSMNSLEIFDYAIHICAENGLKVMFDIHSAQTDAMGHMTNLWYTDRISVEQYYASIELLADRYKDDDTLIAFDLKNEPHGKPHEVGAIWNDSEDPNNWKYVAETAGNLVLDINPRLLILIEGIEIYPKDLSKNADYASQDSADYHFCWWGGNLRGVRDYPIDFGSPERNAQIVYSPHDYGPDVYQQPWFSGELTYESLQEDCWNDNWLYIHREGITPLLIGEWGGFMREPNLSWMTFLRQLIAEEGIHHTFWCFNANSGDTGGLVGHDFTTWDEEKYEFVKEVLWQEDGHFVGLDHAVPLGKAGNGIALSEATGM